jgi:methyl-accepting chemotaxis protein
MLFNKKHKDEIEDLKEEVLKLKEEKAKVEGENSNLNEKCFVLKRENSDLSIKIDQYESLKNSHSQIDYTAEISQLDSMLKKLIGQDEWVIDSINHIDMIGLEITNTAKAAGQTIENMTRTTKDTSSVINNFTSSFEDLLDRVKSIENISSQISGIASQTQLLSLNASIESARAGEAGRGFTVVAEEIKKLSENTSRLLKDIQNTVRETYNIAVKAKEQAVNLNHGKEDSVLVAKEAKQGFSHVVSKIDEVTAKIAEIKKAGDAHLDFSQEIISKVNSIE